MYLCAGAQLREAQLHAVGWVQEQGHVNGTHFRKSQLRRLRILVTSVENVHYWVEGINTRERETSKKCIITSWSEVSKRDKPACQNMRALLAVLVLRLRCLKWGLCKAPLLLLRSKYFLNSIFPPPAVQTLTCIQDKKKTVTSCFILVHMWSCSGGGGRSVKH